MYPAELSIHLSKKEVLRFSLTEYAASPSFTTVKIASEGQPTIIFFMNELSDIVAFKNSILWAFEKHIKERTL